MKKLGFYPRMALAGLWRNRRTYVPYLLASVVSVFTFYTMLAINTNGALNGIRGESVVKSFSAVGAVVLALFCGVLIFYTNSFLIKRRKQEMGLYSILGMEKKNIAVLMLFETLFAASAALVLGLGLGMLLSRLIYLVLLRMVRMPVTMNMPISPAALAITAVFFGLVFLLALLRNLWQVRLTDPIGLLAGAKQGEREPKASRALTAVGLLCLAGGYFLALYFTSPLDAIMFFLVAAALVMAGTYCLFTSGSVALLKLLRKNKKFYYTPNHFIPISGMLYRMKQNAAGLATICILSCMVLVTVSSTVSLNVGVEDTLAVQYPYEYEMFCMQPGEADTLLGGAQNIAAQNGVELANIYDYRETSFIAAEQNGAFTAAEGLGGIGEMGGMNLFTLVRLEDYNRSEGKNAVLAHGEALLLVTGGRYSQAGLTVNGMTYPVRRVERIGKNTEGTRAMTREFIMVLPDENAVLQLAQRAGAEQNTVVHRAFDLEGEEAEKQGFFESFSRFIGEVSANGHWRIRDDARQDWYATNGGFVFLGVYLGILFMLAAALIIYYKQMSEGYDDAERFEILQKVGMGGAEVKKAINSQILAVFFLPLLAAVLHVAVAFFPVSRVMVLFGVMNAPLLALASAGTVLAYALVYWLFFRQTAKVYFGIVVRTALQQGS